MVVTTTKLRWLLLALTLAAASLCAQSASGGLERERRLLLFFSVRPEASIEAEEQRLLYESLLLRLSASEAGFLILEVQQEGVPATERERTEKALTDGADAWAWVEVLSGLNAFRYKLSSYDLLTRKKTIDATLGKETPVRLRDLQRRLWEEGAGLLEQAYRAIEYGTRVTFKAVPGTRIEGLTERPLEVGADGAVTVSLPNPSLYSYRASCRDYYPVRGRFNLKDQPLEFELQQEKADRWVLEAGLNTMNFFNLGAGLFLRPNYLFLKLDITPYIAGLFFSGSRGSYVESSLVYSAPLTLLMLQAGGYFNAEDARARLYAAAGAGLRVLGIREHWSLEPISPVVLQLAAGAEIPLFRRLRGYFEYAPRIYLTQKPELLRASFPAGSDPFNYFFLSWMGMDYLNYRLGVRFQL